MTVPSICVIKHRVAVAYGLPFIDLSSDRRGSVIAPCRQIAMYLARRLTGLSLPAIGRAFGNRDHTTVMHAVKRTEKRMSDDDAFRSQIEELEAGLLTPAEDY